jgi:hypothetical protein
MSGPNDPLKSGANDAALRANQLAAEHGIDLSKLPQILDMSADSITDNVHAINSNCPYDYPLCIFFNRHFLSHKVRMSE